MIVNMPASSRWGRLKFIKLDASFSYSTVNHINLILKNNVSYTPTVKS